MLLLCMLYYKFCQNKIVDTCSNRFERLVYFLSAANLDASSSYEGVVPPLDDAGGGGNCPASLGGAAGGTTVAGACGNEAGGCIAAAGGPCCGIYTGGGCGTKYASAGGIA